MVPKITPSGFSEGDFLEFYHGIDHRTDLIPTDFFLNGFFDKFIFAEAKFSDIFFQQGIGFLIQGDRKLFCRAGSFFLPLFFLLWFSFLPWDALLFDESTDVSIRHNSISVKAGDFLAGTAETVVFRRFPAFYLDFLFICLGRKWLPAG